MDDQRVRIVFYLIVVIAMHGCGPPRPPQKINATLPDNSPWAVREQADVPCDTTVIARCVAIHKYAETRSGKWIIGWYFCDWQMVRLERGNWLSPNVSLIYSYSWPTPESGIVLKDAPLPYAKGRFFCFDFDTSTKPARIVGQQRRSYVPPHGPIRRFKYDPDDSAVMGVYESVIQAARRFLDDQQRKVGGMSVTEEHDDFYVVENTYGDTAMAVAVDKKTPRAWWVSPPPD